MPTLTEEKFNINASNEEILETFTGWLAESTSYHDALLTHQEISEQYYIGNQTERGIIPAFNSDTVENRIFEAVETLVPIATATAHQFTVLPGLDNELSMSKADKLQKVLTKKYAQLEIQRKLEDEVRHMVLYRFGVLKWGWSSNTDDISVDIIDPRKIYVPKLQVDPHDLPYKIEKQEYSYNEMLEYFPKVDIDELSQYNPSSTASGDRFYRRTYLVYEVWTCEMVAWISNGKVLEKESNPYWDFEGEEKKVYKRSPKGVVKIKKELVFRNHLDKPTDPYVFFGAFNVSEGSLPSTSLVEIGIPIQDTINVGKRQILNNLKFMGSGQWLIDSDAMPEEEADAITNEPGLVIRGMGVASENKARREPGVPLPMSHFQNLQHSEMVFDNLMGVHAATRGSSGSKTLGQDLLGRQQDYTRIDLLTRVLNRGVERLVNGIVQLMKLYYTENYVVRILGQDGAIEFVRLNRDDIEQGIEIDVKGGQDMPMDAVQLRTEAVQLWQMNGIDPQTLYERLKFLNPQRTAAKLQAWRTGQLAQETQASIIQSQAGAAAKAAVPGGGQGNQFEDVKSKASANATNSANVSSQTGRGVETPANVLQRATQGLGGGAPRLAGKSNG